MATQPESITGDSDFPAPADEYTDDDGECEPSDDDDDWTLEDVEEEPHPNYTMDKYANW